MRRPDHHRPPSHVVRSHARVDVLAVPLLRAAPAKDAHRLRRFREPLLGRTPDFSDFGLLFVMALVGWAVAFAFFAGIRRRVVHYL